MRKILWIAGLFLVILSLGLAVWQTGQIDIIGGADLSTFWFGFYRYKRGLYVTGAFVGVILVLISRFLKKK